MNFIKFSKKHWLSKFKILLEVKEGQLNWKHKMIFNIKDKVLDPCLKWKKLFSNKKKMQY